MGQSPSEEDKNASKGPNAVDTDKGKASAPINMKPRTDGDTPASPKGLSHDVRAQLFAAGAGEVEKRNSPPQPPQQIETVPTTFRWSHGGTQVFVTGSFNNWQGKITMPPSEEGKDFVLVIDIPPGVHQYKYIVDEAWRLDPDMPTCINQGVVNNVIEVKRPVFEDTRAEWGAALAESDDELDENKQKITYGHRTPTQDDYVKDPLKIPPHLGQVLLNSPQVSVDPLVLPLPHSHVTLNHLYVYSGANTDASVLVTGITQRFKLKAFASLTPKFVTTVYYSPKAS
jgi:5'-AMP-activated protein kinase regulatory beta subunit